MKSISMVEENLPAGFRFHPRDEELICDYLMNKLYDHSHNHNHKHSTLLIQVDLNKSEPWELPESACVGGKEWYFYSQRDRKYSTGLRTNRATSCGYWKATGKDRPVLSSKSKSKSKSKSIVGMRKTLVFYQGRAPKGTKTDWVMHEFRLEQPLPLKDKNMNMNKNKNKDDQEDWVLCRVFYKSREMGSNNINITATSSCGFSFNSLPVPALQVPCFSNLPPIPNQHVNLFFQPTPTPIPMVHHDHTADNDNDNEVLKALLLNHMENDPNLECLGDPTSQTCLSQFHMLNHY